ncbi:hypothetical protein C1637_21940 [Chryseobacterium lactis]|uniref:Isochorismatase n=1 Tax=Chryseobacterium lactis TaxID=1241981 RepID=A0A3G6RK26_CHRLC|nr:hypothetical protein [Chryseobacterium lactis]AZA84944.1 hypothetical protein EG342_24900 [Chryseobacterium lactis]AZB05332.1 hypothetical protein EG341_15780 [Chryseobacterium lactis]PNW11481.1 hypothetical protein C1637_21940 [Chryseobacterium lactis]
MKSTPYPSKYASPKGIFEVGKTRFKWYNLAEDLSKVSPEDISNAKTCIESAHDKFQDIDDIGFVILHRCGENYLLLVCTWRSENELWESVYHDGSGKFEIWDRNKNHLPTYCVWEMGIVYHESQAWKRYLGTTKEEEDKKQYLSDMFEGEV